jgi:hypothetical protein
MKTNLLILHSIDNFLNITINNKIIPSTDQIKLSDITKDISDSEIIK